jgi:glycosyltransferase involved in cell wall biosynthesis
MRIGLLSFEYPPETGFGGIGTYTFFHARALSRLGHEVHVLAGATSASRLRRDDHDGVQVWRTRGNGVSAALYRGLGRLDLWWTRERVRNAIDMWSAVRHLERAHPFDVIEMPECGAEGFFVGTRARAPTVVRFHSPAGLIMPFYDVRSRDRSGSTYLESRAIRTATALTSSSGFLAREARDRLGVARAIDVIHNGIDLDWFDEAERIDARAAFDLPADRPLVLFAGRMERRKGIELMPDVVGGVLERSDVVFAFAGDDTFGFLGGVLLPALAARGALRGSVRVLGRLVPQHVRDVMRQADIVFVPSLWESCPYSCLEAMAAGRAIVASDAGGLPELLRHRENALVLPAGDGDGFTAALEELLGDSALRQRLGAAARRTVEESFRDGDVAARSVGVYERAAR